MRKNYTTVVLILLLLITCRGYSQTADSLYPNDDYVTTSGGIPVSFNVLINDVNLSVKNIFISRIECDNPVFGFCEFTDSVITYCPYHSHPGSIDTVKYYIKYDNALIESDSAYLCIWVLNSHAYDSLTVNNINAGVSNCGLLFSRYGYAEYNNSIEYTGPHFEVPKGSGKHTIFCNSLWIGGKNNDSIFLAAEIYRGNGFDFWSGPVSDIYDLSYLQQWNRVWKLTNDTIQYHLTHFNDNGYIIPEPVLTWPGNGNVQYGQAAKLAPFLDQNNNNLYEPELGDAPLIRGDEAVFFIFNDDKFTHTGSEGLKMQLEFHAMVYGFNSTDSVLNNTVFVHYDIYNRSNREYDSTYVGIFTDFDIGDPWDDYIACNVEGGYFYCFNGDSIDGNGQPGTYGSHPPVQSVSIIGGPYLDPDGIDNAGGVCDMSINGINFQDSIIDNERMGMTGFMRLFSYSYWAMTSPVNPYEYYNFLKGIWKDSINLKYGGNGHPQTGSTDVDCKFMYPAETDPCNWGTFGLQPPGYITGPGGTGILWTEENVGNSPYDRRGLGIMGPFTFEPGAKQELDIAYVFARDYNPNDTSASINKLKEYNQILREMVTNDSIIYFPDYHVGFSEKNFNKKILHIYPNPAESFITLNGTMLKGALMIRSVQGSEVFACNLGPASQHKIDISSFNSGMYIITLISESELYIGKFIKL